MPVSSRNTPLSQLWGQRGIGGQGWPGECLMQSTTARRHATATPLPRHCHAHPHAHSHPLAALGTVFPQRRHCLGGTDFSSFGHLEQCTAWPRSHESRRGERSTAAVQVGLTIAHTRPCASKPAKRTSRVLHPGALQQRLQRLAPRSSAHNRVGGCGRRALLRGCGSCAFALSRRGSGSCSTCCFRCYCGCSTPCTAAWICGHGFVGACALRGRQVGRPCHAVTATHARARARTHTRTQPAQWTREHHPRMHIRQVASWCPSPQHARCPRGAVLTAAVLSVCAAHDRHRALPTVSPSAAASHAPS